MKTSYFVKTPRLIEMFLKYDRYADSMEIFKTNMALFSNFISNQIISYVHEKVVRF